MGFLRVLEGIRTPVMDSFFGAVTYVGDEVVFMALAILVFWCVSKRQGYYLFAVGFFGTVINQFLKITCRIPRPWVLDPDFTIVESAREAASGYSFPSGHTQNVVGTLGVIAVSNRQTWVRALCGVFLVLVPFSRMYLGVHTPKDVLVSILIAVVLVVVMQPCFRTEPDARKMAPRILWALAAAVVGYSVYVLVYPFPADIDPHNMASALKNAYTMMGVAAGLLLTYYVDKNYMLFEVEAPLLGQLGKLVVGFALLMGIKAGLKAPLLALFQGHQAATAVRYFLMVIFAGILWPMSFPFWQRLGGKRPVRRRKYR